MELRRHAVVALGAIACCLAACGGGGSSSPTMTPDAHSLLSEVQGAVNSSGGYTVHVTGHNLVLPDWGGVDNGTVQVNSGGTQAVATLQRTGEPGATYSIRLVDGATYFQRSTCNQVFRVPGGGAQVLKPFILQGAAIRSAGNPSISGNVITANLTGVGRVRLTVDDHSKRPSSMVITTADGSSTWQFGEWGVKLSVEKPSQAVQDRGPGGIPC